METVPICVWFVSPYQISYSTNMYSLNLRLTRPSRTVFAG